MRANFGPCKTLEGTAARPLRDRLRRHSES